MKLSETQNEVYLRFDRLNGVWFELEFVKSEARFVAFRCNAYCEDPAWQKMSAATIAEATRAVSAWLRRN